MSVWIEISFDGEPMDNMVADTINEAHEIIKKIEKNGFSEYNEEVKEEWLNMGFRNNPLVSAKITDGC